MQSHHPAMKLRRLLVLAFCSAPLAAFAAPVVADSRVTAVTVYTDRAVVTRTATVNLTAPGAAEVTFEKLPVGILDQSLTVSGRGTAQATILDVTARIAHVEFTPNERVKLIEDQLRALAKDRRGLDDRTKLLETQRTSIDQTAAALFSPASKDVPRPTVAEVTAALAFVSEQRTKITADLVAVDDQREALAAKQSALERQLAQLRGAGGKSYKTVTIRLDAATAGNLDLALGYAVGGASWTPSYDVRANHRAQLLRPRAPEHRRRLERCRAHALDRAAQPRRCGAGDWDVGGGDGGYECCSRRKNYNGEGSIAERSEQKSNKASR